MVTFSPASVPEKTRGLSPFPRFRIMELHIKEQVHNLRTPARKDN